MRLLHTSDWHLGARLHGQSRFDESMAFLDWLHNTIRDNAVDVLVVSGDVFDTSSPGSSVQSLYYNFLASLEKTNCHNVVVIAGNHDSPSLLSAAGEVLRRLNIHVVGAATDDLSGEVIQLKDQSGAPMMLVAAVPYLREADIRTPEAGENPEIIQNKMALGIAAHYKSVCDLATGLRTSFPGTRHVPLVVMGHLHVAGQSVSSSERRLYIGGLGQVDGSIFPAEADYVALGHLHKAQRLGDRPHFRYCGSPLQLGFDDAGQNKFVYIAEFSDTAGSPPEVTHIPVPVWQKLDRVRGTSGDEIVAALQVLIDRHESVWVDVHYEGETMAENLAGTVHGMTDGTPVLVLGIYDLQHKDSAMTSSVSEETLQDLDPRVVFQRRLDLRGATPEQQQKLLEMFDEILFEIGDRDASADTTTAG